MVLHQPTFKSSDAMMVGLGAESVCDSMILRLGKLGDGWSAKWTPIISLKAKTASARISVALPLLTLAINLGTGRK